MNYYCMSDEELFWKWSKGGFVRSVAMGLCYELGGLTQKEIGEVFGVDYSTISSNCKG